MKKQKLYPMIIVDGMCGVVKSTTTRKLSRQFTYHSLPHRWLHEDVNRHPIRHHEFEIDDCMTKEGMDINVKDMINRWQGLADLAVAFGGTYIIEGCFIHAIDRHFAGSAYNVEQTFDYFDNVSKILAKTGALFIYLRSPNVKLTLENAFNTRG